MKISHDQRVLIIGAGGHAKVVIDVLRSANWSPYGLLDPHPHRPTVLEVPVLGSDEVAATLFEQGIRNAIVAIGENALRHRLGRALQDIGYSVVTAIHATATISPSATLGVGVVVMPHAVVNAEVRVGDFAIINTGAVIEHDCVLGEAVHIAPRAVLGGKVTIGDEVLFGVGAIARPLSRIGANAIVGAGAVVIGTILQNETVVGIPARPIGQRNN
jgi:UDP-perosamine 4-acetyltransferase